MSFCSQYRNRNFTPRRDSKTSLVDVRLAEELASSREVDLAEEVAAAMTVPCSKLYALPVVRKPWFLLSPVETVRFTAVTASRPDAAAATKRRQTEGLVLN